MKNWLTFVSFGVVAGFAVSAVADDDHDRRRQQRVFRAELVGFNEVPSVSSPAKGQFYAIANQAGTEFTFWLSYSGLRFAAAQAHIHFGQHHTNGGISVWLCQSATNPAPASVAARVKPCDPETTSMPITATIKAEDVVGPPGQGVAASGFAELLAAMRAGAAYANVHSGVASTPPAPLAGFVGGEIRGQIN